MYLDIFHNSLISKRILYIVKFESNNNDNVINVMTCFQYKIIQNKNLVKRHNI